MHDGGFSIVNVMMIRAGSWTPFWKGWTDDGGQRPCMGGELGCFRFMVHDYSAGVSCHVCRAGIELGTNGVMRVCEVPNQLACYNVLPCGGEHISWFFLSSAMHIAVEEIYLLPSLVATTTVAFSTRMTTVRLRCSCIRRIMLHVFNSLDGWYRDAGSNGPGPSTSCRPPVLLCTREN